MIAATETLQEFYPRKAGGEQYTYRLASTTGVLVDWHIGQ